MLLLEPVLELLVTTPLELEELLPTLLLEKEEFMPLPELELESLPVPELE
jgi:hypothetical protein